MEVRAAGCLPSLSLHSFIATWSPGITLSPSPLFLTMLRSWHAQGVASFIPYFIYVSISPFPLCLVIAAHLRWSAQGTGFYLTPLGAGKKDTEGLDT